MNSINLFAAKQPFEVFTIYDTATGKIRGVGYGPLGTGALQVKPGQACLYQYGGDPEKYRVDVTGDAPKIVLNPDYKES